MKLKDRIKSLFGWAKEKTGAIIMHPELKKPIKPAIKIDGVQYFEFTSNLDMPSQRYLQLSGFLTQMEMGIDRDTYIKLLEKQRDCFNKNPLDITTAIIINDDLIRRATTLIETDILYRMASVVFFNLADNEDLRDYDYDYNTQKIEKFKGVNVVNFFLHQPLSKYLPVKDLSESVLKNYLSLTKAEKERSQSTLARK